MTFEYRITDDEYASAQALYHQLSGGRKRILRTACYIISGFFFVVVAFNQRPIDWAQFLLAALGTWWIYAGIMCFLLPARYFRRHYAASELRDITFGAVVNDEGFDVVCDTCTWRVKWQGVRLRGESNRVFMFCSFGTIFIFGKQYLKDEQQETLRSLSGLGRQTE
jgi:hypothetical protein